MNAEASEVDWGALAQQWAQAQIRAPPPRFHHPQHSHPPPGYGYPPPSYPPMPPPQAAVPFYGLPHPTMPPRIKTPLIARPPPAYPPQQMPPRPYFQPPAGPPPAPPRMVPPPSSSRVPLLPNHNPQWEQWKSQPPPAPQPSAPAPPPPRAESPIAIPPRPCLPPPTMAQPQQPQEEEWSYAKSCESTSSSNDGQSAEAEEDNGAMAHWLTGTAEASFQPADDRNHDIAHAEWLRQHLSNAGEPPLEPEKPVKKLPAFLQEVLDKKERERKRKAEKEERDRILEEQRKQREAERAALRQGLDSDSEGENDRERGGSPGSRYEQTEEEIQEIMIGALRSIMTNLLLTVTDTEIDRITGGTIEKEKQLEAKRKGGEDSDDEGSRDSVDQDVFKAPLPPSQPDSDKQISDHSEKESKQSSPVFLLLQTTTPASTLENGNAVEGQDLGSTTTTGVINGVAHALGRPSEAESATRIVETAADGA
ncbi:hypothetical protein QR680_010785 [Steinernema hermaphroditum]|uniref:Uncharacterized protein n=1 Tax=Steinernema hermaphroditum TaxID=289476 RepID=A0AA39MCD6_9BILA|nr:hypothetical protein QR680_010785 [Steinernema hermaphroditum]